MRSTTVLLPILVIILGGGWLFYQQNQISILEEKTSDLKSRLETATSNQRQTAAKNSSRKTALDAEQVDWVQVSKELGSARVQYGIYTSAFKLEEQIRRLSAAELKEGLRDLEASSLEDRILIGLTQKLLGLLLEKDPSYILLNPSDDPRTMKNWGAIRHSALAKWAKSAPDEAAEWFDSQPDGTFDAEEHQRLNHGLISSLTVSDFPAALERFSAIPEQQRVALFEDFNAFGSYWSEEDFAQHNLTFRYAELTRLLPDEASVKIVSPLTWLGEQDRPNGIYSVQKNLQGWMDQKPGKLSMEVFRDYVSKINPSTAELDQCIDAVIAAKVLDLPDQPEREPEALREWLRSELQPAADSE